MWILTQNKERLLTTESMDEIRIAAPGTGRTDYVLLLNRKTDRKELALGLPPEGAGERGAPGHPEGTVKLHLLHGRDGPGYRTSSTGLCDHPTQDLCHAGG